MIQAMHKEVTELGLDSYPFYFFFIRNKQIFLYLYIRVIVWVAASGTSIKIIICSLTYTIAFCRRCNVCNLF